MAKSVKKISEEDALALLDEADQQGGVNAAPEPPKSKSLGKSMTHQAALESEISMANDVRWKVIPFNTLPSLGLFYPEDSEISIRSADVLEIRHWSTIDENDQVSINDCLNFILEKCLKFKIKGRPVILSWRDLTLVDRFFLIFKIHELTFPNGENKLMKTFDCTSCPSEARYSGRHQVRGSMLQGFRIPEELQQFYRSDYRAFSVESDKIGSFYMFMPTLGSFSLVKSYMTERANKGKSTEKWFVRVAPYLIDDYQSMTIAEVEKLRLETLDWHRNRVMFVTKAVDLLEKAKNNKLVIKCPNCGKNIEADIFSLDSFTIKNLFVFSAQLADLI